MTTTYETLWAFGEDILELRKEFKEEFEAHTSQPLRKPLHRYEGELILENDGILLLGRNKDTQEEFFRQIAFKEISDVYLGWDNMLRRWRNTRAWIKPLRLTIQNQQKKVLYIYSKKPRAKIYGRDNKALSETLSAKVT
jgi:hypothetical protein